MAGTTGLEPATSDVTGRRSNQLNYVPDKPTDNLQLTTYNRYVLRFSDLRCELLVTSCKLVSMVGGTGIEPVTPAL